MELQTLQNHLTIHERFQFHEWQLIEFLRQRKGIQNYLEEFLRENLTYFLWDSNCRMFFQTGLQRI